MDPWPYPLWIAHRGAGKLAPENTLAAFRLAELTRYSLWYDELFSLTIAQMDWGDLVSASVADRTTPPLFYALLKLWIAIGGISVAWIRLLPCLCSILAGWTLLRLSREYGLDDFTTAATLAATAAISFPPGFTVIFVGSS